MAFVPLLGNTAVSRPTPSFTPIDITDTKPAAPTPSPFLATAEKVASYATDKIQGASSAISSFSPFASAVAKFIPSVASEIPAAIQTFKETPTTPKSNTAMAFAGGTAKAFNDALDAGFSGVKDSQKTINDYHSSLLQQGAALGEAGVHVVNTIFGVALSPLQGLATVPGIGSIVDVVNKTFSAISEGSGTGAVNTLKSLPLSPETKKTLEPLVHDTAGLAAQFAIGHLTGDMPTKISKLTDNSKQILTAIKEDPTISETLQSHTKGEEPSNPTSSFAKIAGSDTPTSITRDIQQQMPSLQYARAYDIAARSLEVAPAERPTFIQSELSQIKPGSLQSFPSENTRATAADTASTPTIGETKAPSTPEVKTDVPQGEAVNTRADKLLQAAVEKKLTETLGQVPTHEKLDMAEQASRVVDYIEQNPEKALETATGKPGVPEGISPEAVYTALEIKAIKEGDIETIQKLAQSEVPTEAGRRMKALDSNDPNSPVKIIRDIQKAREALAEKRTKKPVTKAKNETVNDIKREVKANSSKRVSWEEFAKNLTCNI